MNRKSALMIIDMQMIMQERMETGRQHVNSEAPARIASLITVFREAGDPVIHVRHRDEDPGSPLHPEAAGYPPMSCARENAGEAVFIKTSSSAFSTTNLESYLRGAGITDLLVVGAVAGFCVNSTVRAGADIGFKMTVVRDAVIGFDLPSAALDASTIFEVTMGLLEADFATIVESQAIIKARSAKPQ